MNFTTIIKGGAKVASRIGLQISKHAPEILTGLGIAGFVGTVALAIDETPAAVDILNETKTKLEAVDVLLNSEEPAVAEKRERYEYTPEKAAAERRRWHIDAARKLLKVYWKALVVGTLSIAAILCAHNIAHSRMLAITAIADATQKAFDEYRQRVEERVGPEVEKEIRYGLKKKTITAVETLEDGTEEKTKVEKAEVRTGEPVWDCYTRIFDESNPNYKRGPGYNKNFLIGIQKQANDRLHKQGHLFLNELLDMMSFPRTPEGAVCGWVEGNGDNYVDLGIFDSCYRPKADFINGYEQSVILHFNCDGVIYNLL